MLFCLSLSDQLESQTLQNLSKLQKLQPMAEDFRPTSLQMGSSNVYSCLINGDACVITHAPLTPATNSLNEFKHSLGQSHTFIRLTALQKSCQLPTFQMSLAAFRPTVHPFSSRGMCCSYVGCVHYTVPYGVSDTYCVDCRM